MVFCGNDKAQVRLLQDAFVKCIKKAALMPPFLIIIRCRSHLCPMGTEFVEVLRLESL